MRFTNRLGAVVLAIVMMVSSVQIPGGTSYASEPANGGTTIGQNATILTVEETEGAGTAKPDEGALTDDDSRTGGDSQQGDGNATDDDSQQGDENRTGGDSQQGDGNAAGDDSQQGDENRTGDDSQQGDGNAAGGDSQADDDNPAGDDNQSGDDNSASDDDQPDHENASEEETDAGQVSGNDAGEPAQSVDPEETEAEESEIVVAEIKGAYQFDDAPSVGGMSVFSVSTYDNSVEDYLYQQMLKRADCIDISAYNVSASDVGSLVSGVLNEHPDLYFVSREYSIGYQPPYYETIADLYMTYSTDYDDAAFKRKAEAALACVTDGMSDDMKATVLHDYLVINVEYDYDNYLSGNIPGDSFNAYGTLVNGTAVCNGYALAYKYLLNQAGIECCMVTSRSMNHAWNMVKLDGEYYHVDTTWDDPVRDMVGRVCHDNLFRSDTNFGEHYGWTVTSGSSAVNYKATDPKYENAFWTDSKSPLVFDGTDCYYISNTGMSLKKTPFSNINATGTDVVSVGRWMSASGGYWVGAFSGLYMINGRLFYNDGNSIYSIKPDGTDKKTEFTPDRTGSSQIYYSAYRNGKVVYALQTSPNLSEKQTVLTAEIEGVGEPETPPEPEKTYIITYVLDGGTNDKDNPATYTAGTKTIVLKDAVKAGCKFEGWYKDSAYKQRVVEIPEGSTGDITLYAKWKADQVVTDPDQPENIRTGVYVRFTDYYRLGENSRPCYKYTGAAVKPAVEVYNNGTLLTLGTDYTIAYKNNTKVGVASLTVKGKGSFSGASNAVSFEIINADICTDTDHPIKMTVIAGTKVAPLIMNGAKKLTTKDYRLEGDNLVGGKYAKPTEGTPYTLTVTGIGGYEGSSFTIAVTVVDKKAAKKLAVTVDKNFKPVYDGRALDLDSLFCSPGNTGGSIKVTDSKNKNTVLEKGKDFSVLCTSSLRDAGTVKFTVTGMGEYTGSVSKSFKISPLKVTDNIKFEVTFDSREYGYKPSGATVDNLKVTYLGATTSADDDIVLTQGIDYKVSYVNNKKVSTEAKKAQVKITFLGSYKGSKPVSKNFTIAAARMSMTAADAQAANTKVIVPDKVYDKAGKAYKSTPIVMVDGAGIKASNYTVSYAWAAVTYAGIEGRYADGNKVRLEEADSYAKVKVTITLKGANYALADGTTAIEGEYCVRRKAVGVMDLSKAKVIFRDKDGNQLKALEYNGRAYYTPEGNNPEGSSGQADPNAVYVSVTVNGMPVDPSLYDVAWTNATAKGKATVVVTGKGTGAVGSRSQTINIKAMALKGRDITYFMVNMANSLKNIL